MTLLMGSDSIKEASKHRVFNILCIYFGDSLEFEILEVLIGLADLYAVCLATLALQKVHYYYTELLSYSSFLGKYILPLICLLK